MVEVSLKTFLGTKRFFFCQFATCSSFTRFRSNNNNEKRTRCIALSVMHVTLHEIFWAFNENGKFLENEQLSSEIPLKNVKMLNAIEKRLLSFYALEQNKKKDKAPKNCCI